MLDCTSQFQERPTAAQLRSYVAQYLKNTALTEPDIDIKIDFAQLWQTPGYADVAEAERVNLCDTVHVYISKLGFEVSCKVTETELLQSSRRSWISVPTGELECFRLSVRRSSEETSRALAMRIMSSRLGYRLPDSILLIC